MKRIMGKKSLLTIGLVAGGSYYLYDKMEKEKRFGNPNSTGLLAFDRRGLFESQAKEQIYFPRDEATGQVVLHTNREENLKALENASEFDIIIVGGGSVGASAALDATSRGLKVALIERNDWASGTSSRATKMAHGGVRYLEKAVLHLDWNELMLVYECLRERKHFFQVAPHLSSPLKLLTPCYSLYDSLKMFAGLTLYDFLSGAEARLGHSGWLTTKKSLNLWPSLKKEGLYGCMTYYDGVFNDSRVNVSAVLTSNALGALTLNYMEVTDLIKSQDPKNKDTIIGVKVFDRIGNKAYEIKGKCVVNATGPFTDKLRQLDDPLLLPIMSPSAGTHVMFDLNKFTSENGRDVGVLFPKTSDGRVLYLVPWEGKLIAGTTDIPTNLSETPSPTKPELEFIVDTMNTCLSEPVQVNDITSSWCGIRPLVKPVAQPGESTKSISRDHYIEVSKNKMVTVAGGKWTSFRKIGEDTIDTVLATHPQMIGILSRPISRTAFTPLIGASSSWEGIKEVKKSPSTEVSDDAWEHLKHFYGDRATYVLEMSQKNGLTKPLSSKYPFIEGEVLYQVKHEMVVKPSDVIAYRLSLMFVDKNEAKQVTQRVVDIMGDCLNWDKERRVREASETLAYIDKCTQ